MHACCIYVYIFFDLTPVKWICTRVIFYWLRPAEVSLIKPFATLQKVNGKDSTSLMELSRLLKLVSFLGLVYPQSLVLFHAKWDWLRKGGGVGVKCLTGH
jgi:hypothetical protein